MFGIFFCLVSWWRVSQWNACSQVTADSDCVQEEEHLHTLRDEGEALQTCTIHHARIWYPVTLVLRSLHHGLLVIPWMGVWFWCYENTKRYERGKTAKNHCSYSRGQNATFCWWNICNCMTWLFISSYKMPKVHVLITKHHVKMSGKVILFAKAPPIQTPFLAVISLSISSICHCRVISLISQSRLDQYHAKERCPPYRGAPLGESWW